MSSYRYTQVTYVPKKPDVAAGWTIFALIAATVGGVSAGWGGAAVAFVLVCVLYGFCDAGK